MHYAPHLPVAHISLKAIIHNFRLVGAVSAAARKSAGGEPAPAPLHGQGFEGAHFAWPEQMAVIKADAYGHGHIEVARSLAGHGARMFASGSVQESAELRQGLEGLAGLDAPVAILSLLGLVGPADVPLCLAAGVIPVIHSFSQLPLLAALEAPLSVAVKCNTGMSRLGFNEEELPELKEALSRLPMVRPVLCLSHLASADTDRGREEVAKQGGRFARMLASLRAVWPDMAASFGNSAGTFLAEDISRLIGPHICRPGISLYGSSPFEGTALAGLGEGLKPAMSVSAPIIAVRELKAGDGLGYGHTFVADKPTPIGIVAAGYADSYSRGLSNRGVMCIEGVRAPVIGRVSMQMTAVSLADLPRKAAAPQPARAWILGGPHEDALSAHELARLWGTISYEVMCLLGYNQREYLD